MNLIQPGEDSIKFASSAEAQDDKDLLTVTYKRVQKASPDFATVHDGVDQSIDVKISTFIFRAAPEPVVSLYDFVMATFVPQQTTSSLEMASIRASDNQQPAPATQVSTNPDKIRLTMKLATVQGRFLLLVLAMTLTLESSYTGQRSCESRHALLVHCRPCFASQRQYHARRRTTWKPGSQ
jgi:hypothetical protein